MGSEITVEAGYGFMFGQAQLADFTSLFDIDPNGDLQEWVGAQLVTPEGFSGDLVLLEQRGPTNTDSLWAIVALDSWIDFDPTQRANIWELNDGILNERTGRTLVALRDKLFPIAHGEPDIRPSVGWLLISSIF